MPQALFLAFRQLGDPAFRLPLILGVLGAALAVLGLIGLAAWLAGWAAAGGPEWLSWITQAGGAAAGVFLGWWLFLPVALGIASLFTDSIAGAVERRHYPGMAAPSGASALAQLGHGLWFGVKLLVLQMLLLPLFFIPILGALLALLIWGAAALAAWAAAGGPAWLTWITQAGGAAAGVFLGWWLFLPIT
ncbi:MAG: EI24 domain-containing protein, partial [Alphaproteobacteria bacterium]